MKTFSLLALTFVLCFEIGIKAQIPNITNQPASRAVWPGGNAVFSVGVSGTAPLHYQWMRNGTNLPNSIISTVAGNGVNNATGDGGLATNASVSPFGVAFDNSGNLLIADYAANQIRKVDTNGIISTVAGLNVSGYYSGDGGAATNATMFGPEAVAVDSIGNIYIVDHGDGRIRKVGTNGIISTVAGDGPYGGFYGDGGTATNAHLSRPSYGIAVDTAGNLFISDTGNSRIRKVNTNGIISTYAGGGTGGDGGAATNASLNSPYGLALDAKGNLFIADWGANVVRKVGTNGIISTVAGTGANNYSGDGAQATNATLSYPYAVTVDADGNLYIADFSNSAVRKVGTNGIITTFCGNGYFSFYGDGGAATNAELFGPTGLALDRYGNLFIADSGNRRARKVINTQGIALGLNNAGMGDSGNYQVVVTGSGGNASSLTASLLVTNAPVIYQSARNTNGAFALKALALPGSTNVVYCATNPSPSAVWLPVATNFAGADGNWQFTDTNAATFKARFYRSLTR